MPSADILPPMRAFVDRACQGRVRPVFREIPYVPPAALYPAFSGAPSILLESVKGTPRIARYSFIAFEPYLELRVKDGTTEISGPEGTARSGGHPLRAIRSLLAPYPQERDPGLPPFQGGAAGLFGYDFAHYIERLPKTARDDLMTPDAHLLMIDRLISFDHLKRRAWAVAAPGARRMRRGGPWPARNDWAAYYDQAKDELGRIYGMAAQAAQRAAAPTGPTPRPGARVEIVSAMPEKDYAAMVRRAKDYIAAGDIFQANLSLRVDAALQNVDPWDMYSTLRRINPSPFAGFMDMGGYQVVSSSPERLVMLREGVLETRPIAGTRPRGGTREEDRRLAAELLLNEKERAEHVMLIDLERNDLGKVSAYGSVEVDELMTTEEYSHVIHIVSNVRGRLHEGKGNVDALRAVFPGGTITGVPKVRCMQIIDELEPTRRGPYTGSMGYLAFTGDMDLNIVIRTFTVMRGMAYAQAGAGIVADSDPGREYRESLKKAEALIKTLEHMR